MASTDYQVCHALIFDYIDGLGTNREAGIIAIVQSQGARSIYPDATKTSEILG